MRCMSCGAEMILVNVVEDETMMVRGFERHTYMCSACSDVERRFVFNKPNRQHETGIAPILAASPIAPPSTVQDQRTAPQHLLKRLLTKILSQ